MPSSLAPQITPDQRRVEVARLLALAVQRLATQRMLASEGNVAKPDPQGLEVPRKTVLSVHTG